MEARSRLHLLGGPRGVGKSTILEAGSFEPDIVNTGEYIFETAKKTGYTGTKKELLENGLPPEYGQKFIERVLEEPKDDIVLDTHFYCKGHLGLPLENLHYLGKNLNQEEINVMLINCEYDSLLERRKEKGLSNNPIEAMDDMNGNKIGQRVYKEVLGDYCNVRSLRILNEELQSAVEDIESILNKEY